MNEHSGVLVGVDGSAGSRSAVRYAATEAKRRSVPLHVIHVYPDFVPMAPMMPLLPEDMRDLGNRLLAEAVRVAGQAAPTVRVTGRLIIGYPVWELVDSSAEAELMVLGRETTRAWGRVFTAAVTMGVAAKAQCPVVTVPTGWTEPRQPRGPIAVGFKTADHGGALLEHAFAEAADRGARLTVVHAWELPSCYDDIIVRRTHDQEWNLAALDRIEAQIEDLCAEHPDVDVDVRVMHKQPAQALREASQESDLLMLARRGSGPSPLHLGGTARAVLREAACPVEIFPSELASGDEQDRQLEQAGAALK